MQRQIRARHDRIPLRMVPVMKTFAQWNSGFAQNAGEVSERIQDALLRAGIRGPETRRPAGSSRGGPPNSPAASFQQMAETALAGARRFRKITISGQDRAPHRLGDANAPAANAARGSTATA